MKGATSLTLTASDHSEGVIVCRAADGDSIEGNTNKATRWSGEEDDLVGDCDGAKRSANCRMTRDESSEVMSKSSARISAEASSCKTEASDGLATGT